MQTRSRVMMMMPTTMTTMMMRSHWMLAVTLVFSCHFVLLLSALDPIVVKGSKFFNSATGDQFLIRGAAYQPSKSGTDPLSDSTTCRRDVARFKDLGLNAIRVYQTDPRNNHDACMKMLEDAGIYLLLDLADPAFSVNRKQPDYTADLLAYYKYKVQAFAKYPNMLGFIAGNEVSNDAATSPASAMVKALLRDTKAYVRTMGKDRQIPVGYASNDDPDIRMQLAHYFNCGDKQEQADFFGVNLYQWCGDGSNYETSGYSTVVRNFTDFNVPVFLSEYGCNAVRPRTFPEVGAIYTSPMADVISGGVVYQYTQEENDYGLVDIKSATDASPRADYHNFKNQLSSATGSGSFTGVKMADYNPSNSADSECPAVTNTWRASSKLPSRPSAAGCKCMMRSVHCEIAQTPATHPSMSIQDFGTAASNVLDVICGKISCRDIAVDPPKGTYGRYSGCSQHEKVSWALNAYFQKMGRDRSACDFEGFAKLSESADLVDDSSCADMMDSAGSADDDGSGAISLDDLMADPMRFKGGAGSKNGTKANGKGRLPGKGSSGGNGGGVDDGADSSDSISLSDSLLHSPIISLGIAIFIMFVILS